MTREEANRAMEEIKEIMECDADIETKYKMIYNILTAKPHCFEKKEPCEDAVSRQEVLGKAIDYGSGTMLIPVNSVKALTPVTPAVCIAKVTFNKDDLQELAKEKIKEITVEQEQRWIPTSERLPEITDYYLIQYSREICPDEKAVAFYSVEEKESDPNYEWEFKPQCGEYKEVLAWMPLPYDYKEGKESE